MRIRTWKLALLCLCAVLLAGASLMLLIGINVSLAILVANALGRSPGTVEGPVTILIMLQYLLAVGFLQIAIRDWPTLLRLSVFFVLPMGTVIIGGWEAPLRTFFVLWAVATLPLYQLFVVGVAGQSRGETATDG